MKRDSAFFTSEERRVFLGKALKVVTTQKVRDTAGDYFVDHAPIALQRFSEIFIDFPIPQYLRKSEVLFIHIPKTAGISISDALYGCPSSTRTALFYRSSDPQFFSRRFKFAIVRNPWDRTVSTYEFYRSGGTPSAKISKAKAPPRSVLRSFETYVYSYLLPNREKLSILDHALREQYKYVVDAAGNQIVDYIGRFEELDAVQAKLLTMGAISTPFNHLNRSPTRSEFDYRKYYTSNDLIDAVHTCYRGDVSRYGYDF